jgi:hypothetical protein
LPKENESKEKAANHLIRNMRISLRCSQRADDSESRFSPPNRFTALYCAAQLREMAI